MSKKILLLSTTVNGIKFHPGKDHLSKIKPRSILVSDLEPDNKFDKNAVELHFCYGEETGPIDSVKLGYVPAKFSQIIAALLTIIPLEFKVTSVNPSALEVLIDIYGEFYDGN